MREERVGETCQEGEKSIEVGWTQTSTAETRDGYPFKKRKDKTREIITTTWTNK
jgi:hypothetical protein